MVFSLDSEEFCDEVGRSVCVGKFLVSVGRDELFGIVAEELSTFDFGTHFREEGEDGLMQ